jgi:hypothetical protein
VSCYQSNIDDWITRLGSVPFGTFFRQYTEGEKATQSRGEEQIHTQRLGWTNTLRGGAFPPPTEILVRVA